MLAQAVDAYLTLRRACGFKLRGEGYLLRSFAAFSAARDQHCVGTDIAIEWAGLTSSPIHRARRLAAVIRFARHIRAEEPGHELPPPYYRSARSVRPVPYILSHSDVLRLVEAVSQFKGLRGDGSGASGDFGLKQTRWRAEGRQAAKHKCLISSRFQSLTRVTGGSPAAEHGLLSADAPEPMTRTICSA